MKQNLLKTMLFSAALVAGSYGGVMADTETTKYDFEDGNKLFTEDSRVTVGIESDANLNSNVVTFTCAKNAQNGYSFAHYDFSTLVKNASKVTVSFDYWNTNGGRCYVSLGDAETRGTTGGSTKITYNSVGALFRIGSNKTDFFINDKKLALATFCDKWLKVEVTVDYASNKVSYVVKDADGAMLSEGTDIDYYKAAKSCTQIDVFGFINNSKMAKIDNLTISADIDKSATYYAATFKETSDLTPDVKVYSDAECTTEVSPNSLKGNTKYYYVATLAGYEDYKGEFTVGTENPSISFTMVKKAQFTYHVNLVDESGNILQTVYTTDEAYEGLPINYSYPKYLTDENGKVTYVCAELSTFGGSVLAAKDASTNVKYKAYKGNAYFVEGEKVISGTNVESENYSSGTAVRGFDTEKELLTIPESGVYRLTYAVCSNNTHDVRQFIVSANDEEIVNKDVNWSVNYVQPNGTITEADQVFAKGTVIKAKGSDTNIILDYILLEKVGEQVAVSDLTYATYVPACNVVAPENVKVYTAKANEAKTSVTLNEIPAGTVIPAGAAVLVGAPAETYTFTASAETASAIGENDLVAATADTKGDGATTYALTKKDGKPVFGLVAEGVTIPEGKAYLQLSAPSAAKFFAIGTGVVTGINEVNAAANDADDAYYTLQGMKTNKAVKGIYIHNGKKVVIK